MPSVTIDEIVVHSQHLGICLRPCRGLSGGAYVHDWTTSASVSASASDMAAVAPTAAAPAPSAAAVFALPIASMAAIMASGSSGSSGSSGGGAGSNSAGRFGCQHAPEPGLGHSNDTSPLDPPQPPQQPSQPPPPRGMIRLGSVLWAVNDTVVEDWDLDRIADLIAATPRPFRLQVIRLVDGERSFAAIVADPRKLVYLRAYLIQLSLSRQAAAEEFGVALSVQISRLIDCHNFLQSYRARLARQQLQLHSAFSASLSTPTPSSSSSSSSSLSTSSSSPSPSTLPAANTNTNTNTNTNVAATATASAAMMESPERPQQPRFGQQALQVAAVVQSYNEILADLDRHFLARFNRSTLAAQMRGQLFKSPHFRDLTLSQLLRTPLFSAYFQLHLTALVQEDALQLHALLQLRPEVPNAPATCWRSALSFLLFGLDGLATREPLAALLADQPVFQDLRARWTASWRRARAMRLLALVHFADGPEASTSSTRTDYCHQLRLLIRDVAADWRRLRRALLGPLEKLLSGDPLYQFKLSELYDRGLLGLSALQTAHSVPASSHRPRGSRTSESRRGKSGHRKKKAATGSNGHNLAYDQAGGDGEEVQLESAVIAVGRALPAEFIDRLLVEARNPVVADRLLVLHIVPQSSQAATAPLPVGAFEFSRSSCAADFIRASAFQTVVPPSSLPCDLPAPAPVEDIASASAPTAPTAPVASVASVAEASVECTASTLLPVRILPASPSPCRFQRAEDDRHTLQPESERRQQLFEVTSPCEAATAYFLPHPSLALICEDVVCQGSPVSPRRVCRPMRLANSKSNNCDGGRGVERVGEGEEAGEDEFLEPEEWVARTWDSPDPAARPFLNTFEFSHGFGTTASSNSAAGPFSVFGAALVLYQPHVVRSTGRKSLEEKNNTTQPRSPPAPSASKPRPEPPSSPNGKRAATGIGIIGKGLGLGLPELPPSSSKFVASLLQRSPSLFSSSASSDSPFPFSTASPLPSGPFPTNWGLPRFPLSWKGESFRGSSDGLEGSRDLRPEALEARLELDPEDRPKYPRRVGDPTTTTTTTAEAAAMVERSCRWTIQWRAFGLALLSSRPILRRMRYALASVRQAYLRSVVRGDPETALGQVLPRLISALTGQCPSFLPSASSSFLESQPPLHLPMFCSGDRGRADTCSSMNEDLEPRSPQAVLRPNPAEMLFDMEIAERYLLCSLGPDQLAEVVAALWLEQKILWLLPRVGDPSTSSSSSSAAAAGSSIALPVGLGPYIGAWLLAALGPLNWCHTYCPSLSPELLPVLLGCPTPFLLGSLGSATNLFALDSPTQEVLGRNEVFVLDLAQGRLIYPETLVPRIRSLAARLADWLRNPPFSTPSAPSSFSATLSAKDNEVCAAGLALPSMRHASPMVSEYCLLNRLVGLDSKALEMPPALATCRFFLEVALLIPVGQTAVLHVFTPPPPAASRQRSRQQQPEQRQQPEQQPASASAHSDLTPPTCDSLESITITTTSLPASLCASEPIAATASTSTDTTGTIASRDGPNEALLFFNRAWFLQQKAQWYRATSPSSRAHRPSNDSRRSPAVEVEECLDFDRWFMLTQHLVEYLRAKGANALATVATPSTSPSPSPTTPSALQ